MRRGITTNLGASVGACGRSRRRQTTREAEECRSALHGAREVRQTRSASGGSDSLRVEGRETVKDGPSQMTIMKSPLSRALRAPVEHANGRAIPRRGAPAARQSQPEVVARAAHRASGPRSAIPTSHRPATQHAIQSDAQSAIAPPRDAPLAHAPRRYTRAPFRTAVELTRRTHRRASRRAPRFAARTAPAVARKATQTVTQAPSTRQHRPRLGRRQRDAVRASRACARLHRPHAGDARTATQTAHRARPHTPSTAHSAPALRTPQRGRPRHPHRFNVARTTTSPWFGAPASTRAAVTTALRPTKSSGASCP